MWMKCCLSLLLLVVLYKQQFDPVGVGEGEITFLCLAETFLAASLVQTGRSEVSHTSIFCGTLLLVIVSVVTGQFLPRL